jgi:hypothetical protein
MERLGFYVCVEDLEEKLIRSVGAARVVALIDSQRDLGSFRSLQRQPQWRGQLAEAQLRRFLGSGATRKLRYARLLAGAVDLDRLPTRWMQCLRAAARGSSAVAGSLSPATPPAARGSRSTIST